MFAILDIEGGPFGPPSCFWGDSDTGWDGVYIDMTGGVEAGGAGEGATDEVGRIEVDVVDVLETGGEVGGGADGEGTFEHGADHEFKAGGFGDSGDFGGLEEGGFGELEINGVDGLGFYGEDGVAQAADTFIGADHGAAFAGEFAKAVPIFAGHGLFEEFGADSVAAQGFEQGEHGFSREGLIGIEEDGAAGCFAGD
ncbi:MAG: hypothetical protein RI897_3714 [Verrucomicrobiota bacterium]